MKKRIVSLFLVVSLLFGIGACAGKTNEETGSFASVSSEQSSSSESLESGSSSNSDNQEDSKDSEETSSEKEEEKEENSTGGGASIPDEPEEVGDTPYTVKYYKNSLQNEFEYEEVPALQETRYGVAGKSVNITSYLLDKYIAGFVYNSVDSEASGVVEEDGSLVLHAYYELNRIDVSNYEELCQGIRFYPNAYLVLVNDIDPVAEYDVREKMWEMITEPFLGVIDGQGFSIKNITLYQDVTPDYASSIKQPLAMFDEFRGELRNVGFDYIRSVPTLCGDNNGNIARFFSGKAENVYFYGLITKTRVDEDFLQYGGMFGVLEDGASVKNCYIDFQCTYKDNCVYDYGYLAGKISGSVTIENIVVVESAICTTYGKFIARYEEGATINGRTVNSDIWTYFVIDKLEIGERAEVVKKAGEVLGNSWVCDGENAPRLKTVYEYGI